MQLARSLVFAVIGIWMAGLSGTAGECSGAPGVKPAVRLDVGAAARQGGKAIRTENLLPDEIPGISSLFISLAPGASHQLPATNDEDRVWLVVAGAGVLAAGGREHPVVEETIAHFPVGWGVEVKAGERQGLDLLLIGLTLTPEDRKDLAAHTDLNSTAYVKTFRECEAYGESIKSAKTVSRTLLPKNIVPRMAIGTVETTGPDKVAPHRHPMLEQYFLGLKDNDIIVVADDVSAPLGAYELFHIPSASNHGAEVEDGRKLYYVWMDFFQDREGLEWLNVHKPLPPEKRP